MIENKDFILFNELKNNIDKIKLSGSLTRDLFEIIQDNFDVEDIFSCNIVDLIRKYKRSLNEYDIDEIVYILDIQKAEEKDLDDFDDDEIVDKAIDICNLSHYYKNEIITEFEICELPDYIELLAQNRNYDGNSSYFELQEWLRDKHKIDIIIRKTTSLDICYYYEVIKDNDFDNSFIGKAVLNSNYESVLNNAIEFALKLIKTN